MAMHVVAAIVGLCAAALIVFLVFGNASEQGASQDGSAPSETSAASATLCGSVDAREAGSAAVLRTAMKHPPSIISPTGVEVVPTRADQRAWFGRVHAASGLCIDEIRVLTDSVSVALSTAKGARAGDAAAFTIGVVAASFQPPLDRPSVRVETYVGGQRRVVVVSHRAWAQFEAQGRSLGLGRSLADLAAFRRRTAFTAADLQLLGWT